MSDVWQDDRLGRKEDATFLLNFLRNRVAEHQRIGRKESFVLNIDAEWGQGKTFFMRGLEHEIRRAGHPVVFIDAWQDDFADDPFTAVMAEIDNFVRPLIEESKGTSEILNDRYKAVKQNFKKIVVASAKGMVTRVATKVVGDRLDEIATLATSVGASPELAKEGAEVITQQLEASTTAFIDGYANKLIANFKEGKSSLQAFRSSLTWFLAALNEAKIEHNGRPLRTPMFVLLDELDRCRPTYAISMLERIKHLFDVPDLVFVVATDTTQMSEAVRAVYGSGFNGAGYLQRFFSQTYELARVGRREIIAEFFTTRGIDSSKLSVPGNATPEDVVVSADEFFQLRLRDLKQCLETLHTVTTAWQLPYPMILPVLFRLIIGSRNRERLDNFADHEHWLGRENELLGQGLGWRLNTPRGEMDMSQLLRTVKSVIQADPMEYLAQERPNSRDHAVGAYVHDVMEEEWRQIRMLNGRNDISGLRSNIYRYPDLIRRAGQIR